MSGPLAGIRILDLTTVLLGPLATQIMGDMGADVIKVEAPEGDITRQVTPLRNPGMGAMFLNANRNKRSLALDLKHPDARAALLRLIAGTDVFVHSMRPKALDRLGLGWETLRALNPGLIFCGAYGFREGGPYAGKPAYDDIIQAASGVAVLQGGDEPRYAGMVLADKTTALTVVYAVTMALFERERSGRGQAIEVPMLETLVAFVMAEHLDGRTFEPPLGTAGYARVLAPHRRPYRTLDGHIGILPYTSAQWRRFFELADRPQMLEDPRVVDAVERSRHIGELYALVAEIMPERSTADWLAALDQADIPAMPVNGPDDLFDDPHLAATGFFGVMEHPTEGTLRTLGIPVGFSDTPGSIRRPAPRLGEHSRELLAEAGLDAEALDGLIASGAVIDNAAIR
jgi:crotonobetainyl-CoA:carnitine CoA-transferase CaiB-like acyl-CoA transferase